VNTNILPSSAFAAIDIILSDLMAAPAISAAKGIQSMVAVKTCGTFIGGIP
jgi:hypothetical protein